MTASTVHARAGSLLLAVLLLAATGGAQAQTSGRSKTRRAPAQAQTARPNPAFDQAVKAGDEARRANRLSEALEYYLKALKLRPTWAEGWWNVGAIFYDGDRYPEARDAFRNFVTLEPKRGAAWGMLGLCEFQTHEYERAVISLQRGRAIGFAGNQEIESVVRYHTALLYIRFEQFEVAFDILNEFMQTGNDSPKVIEAFGLALLRMPFLPAELPPDKRERVLSAGRAGFLMAARRTDEARAAFDELLKRYPNEPNVHYAYGVFLMNQDADAALKEYRRELEISPSHAPALVQMAFEYLKRGEYDTALPLAEKGVQLAPKMFAARNVLGRVLLELGQTERAVKELEEGVRLAPSSPEMHFALARAYTRAGRQAEAARERELFKQLQEQYNARRGPRAGGDSDDNQPKAKP
ncbi:MAG TPA: tetratricopeptide repeat protein [Blastocatellia bacterium]|nr:tetratricopeptide repeat protein [Blastocatellia bacterium]